MNENTDSENSVEFGYKARQLLNEGSAHLSSGTAARLHAIRQAALSHQRVSGLRMAGLGYVVDHVNFSVLRQGVAIAALIVGSVGTYYWNAFQDAREYEEIDSALLSDDLPPSAYLDRGFHAWLERAASNSSSQ